MHIDSANLNNLTKLWQQYGARSLYEDKQLLLRENNSWPNRVWADMAMPVSAASLKQAAKKTLDSAIFPLWPAITEDGSAAPQATVDALVHQSPDWQPAVQHTAMALRLDKKPTISAQTVAKHPLNIKCLSADTVTNADAAAWVATGSKAFGYRIDIDVVTPLLAREDTKVFLAYDENAQPVATGLLFKTADVVGIHQIGVLAEHRGKGYASQMMHFLIHNAGKWQANYAFLQASKAGKPVYQKLGFVDQFLITYLKKYES